MAQTRLDFEINYAAQLIADRLYCPITLELMVEPVSHFVHGVPQVFEKWAIEQWLERHATCPTSNVTLDLKQLYSDVEVDDLLILLTRKVNGKRVLRTAEELAMPLGYRGTCSFLDELMRRRVLLAARSQNADELKKFGVFLSHYVKALDNMHWTPLHFAAAQGNVKKLQLLIEAGADLEAKTKGGMTALAIAVQHGKLDAASHLLQHGATLTPNLLCVANSRPGNEHANVDLTVSLVTLLLKYEPSQADKNAALNLTAGKFGNEAVLSLLLKHGAEINAKDNDGNTPLHKAVVVKNNETTVQLLLNHNADLNALDSNGHTPRQVARNIGFYYEQFQKGFETIDVERNKRAKQQALQSIQLNDFITAYHAAYERAGFFGRNPFSTMHRKLSKGNQGVNSMEEVLAYIHQNQTSRSKQVLDQLIADRIPGELAKFRV